MRAINNDNECQKQNFSNPTYDNFITFAAGKKSSILFYTFSAGSEFGSITRVIGGIVLKSMIFVIVF